MPGKMVGTTLPDRFRFRGYTRRMQTINGPEIARLLARHGIAGLDAAGSDSREAAIGGRLAQIHFAQHEDGPVATVTIAGVEASAHCPLDEAGALALAGRLHERGALGTEAASAHLLAHLLVKMSAAFADSAAEAAIFEDVHLHRAAYHIDRVILKHAEPLRFEGRLAPDSHDRHAVFSHRHGDSTEFPK